MTNLLLVADAYNLELERLFDEKLIVLKDEAKSIYLEVDTLLKGEKKMVINNGLVIEKDLVTLRDFLIKLIVNKVNYENFPRDIEIKQLIFVKYEKFGKAFNEVLEVSKIPKIEVDLINEKLGIR